MQWHTFLQRLLLQRGTMGLALLSLSVSWCRQNNCCFVCCCLFSAQPAHSLFLRPWHSAFWRYFTRMLVLYNLTVLNRRIFTCSLITPLPTRLGQYWQLSCNPPPPCFLAHISVSKQNSINRAESLIKLLYYSWHVYSLVWFPLVFWLDSAHESQKSLSGPDVKWCVWTARVWVVGKTVNVLFLCSHSKTTVKVHVPLHHTEIMLRCCGNSLLKNIKYYLNFLGILLRACIL